MYSVPSPHKDFLLNNFYRIISREKLRGGGGGFINPRLTLIPKRELREFWGDSLTNPPFKVTSAEVVIICPVPCIIGLSSYKSPPNLGVALRHLLSPRCRSQGSKKRST